MFMYDYGKTEYIPINPNDTMPTEPEWTYDPSLSKKVEDLKEMKRRQKLCKTNRGRGSVMVLPEVPQSAIDAAFYRAKISDIGHTKNHERNMLESKIIAASPYVGAAYIKWVADAIRDALPQTAKEMELLADWIVENQKGE